MSERLTKICEYHNLPHDEEKTVAIWTNPLMRLYLQVPSNGLRVADELKYLKENRDTPTIMLIEANKGSEHEALLRYDKDNCMFDAIKEPDLLEDVVEKNIAHQLSSSRFNEYIEKLEGLNENPNFHFIPVFLEHGKFTITEYNEKQLKNHTNGKNVLFSGYRSRDIVPALTPEGTQLTRIHKYAIP